MTATTGADEFAGAVTDSCLRLGMLRAISADLLGSGAFTHVLSCDAHRGVLRAGRGRRCPGLT
jgi:hypothetical protein